MDIREFLTQHPLRVAPALLGWRLAKDGCLVELTELEAYSDAEDPGSHAFSRRTPRNAPMFGLPGCAYVYFCYGNHWMLNVVAHETDRAGAVLVRGARALEGLPLLRGRRPSARGDRDLIDGPGKLTQALAIDRSLNGADLLSANSPLRLLPPDRGSPFQPPPGVMQTRRIGLARGKGEDLPWRFVLPG
ncbi:MAG: DNA-3-methyladenine glycosylase [Fimbriimonadales bacterium]